MKCYRPLGENIKEDLEPAGGAMFLGWPGNDLGFLCGSWLVEGTLSLFALDASSASQIHKGS